jgi:large subunit ribosomal protein L7/L12
MADIEKMIEEIKGMTVLELNSLVKKLEEEFGVSAAAPVAVAAGPAAAAAAPVAEEKTEFTVVLKGYDAAAKLKIVRAVKDATGLGLGEAKALVDNAPKAVKENVSKEECDKLVAALKEAGAEVEVK